MSTELVAFNLGASASAAYALENACIKYGIETPLQKSHFFAQIAHESGGFSRTRESLNYSVSGLLRTFGRHRITEAQANRYGRTDRQPANQQALANILYGGEWGRRNLGNTEEGDGWKFIGRGFKQITGRYNYTVYSLATYGDLRIIEDPAAVERVDDAALSAAWYWKTKNLNSLADRDNLEAITRVVNGALTGIQDRAAWLAKAKYEFSKTY